MQRGRLEAPRCLAALALLTFVAAGRGEAEAYRGNQPGAVQAPAAPSLPIVAAIRRSWYEVYEIGVLTEVEGGNKQFSKYRSVPSGRRDPHGLTRGPAFPHGAEWRSFASSSTVGFPSCATTAALSTTRARTMTCSVRPPPSPRPALPRPPATSPAAPLAGLTRLTCGRRIFDSHPRFSVPELREASTPVYLVPLSPRASHPLARLVTTLQCVDPRSLRPSATRRRAAASVLTRPVDGRSVDTSRRDEFAAMLVLDVLEGDHPHEQPRASSRGAVAEKDLPTCTLHFLAELDQNWKPTARMLDGSGNVRVPPLHVKRERERWPPDLTPSSSRLCARSHRRPSCPTPPSTPRPRTATCGQRSARRQAGPTTQRWTTNCGHRAWHGLVKRRLS